MVIAAIPFPISQSIFPFYIILDVATFVFRISHHEIEIEVFLNSRNKVATRAICLCFDSNIFKAFGNCILSLFFDNSL
jgi:hypothetical protein